MWIEVFGVITAILAVSGVILNNRLKISCFYLWLVSNALSATLHGYVGLWSLVIRDVIFFGFAIEGVAKWWKNGMSVRQNKDDVEWYKKRLKLANTIIKHLASENQLLLKKRNFCESRAHVQNN